MNTEFEITKGDNMKFGRLADYTKFYRGDDMAGYEIFMKLPVVSRGADSYNAISIQYGYLTRFNDEDGCGKVSKITAYVD